MTATPHTEIPVKVNAWIDEGIAPIVFALNRFPEVVTLDSCEGRDGSAYVHFAVRGDAADLSAFVHDLSVGIGKRVSGDCEYCLRIEWVAGSDTPMATLYSRIDYVEPVSNAIEDYVSGSPTTASVYGT